MGTLQDRYAERAKTPLTETWVAASLGWDPRGLEERFAVRFAESHGASLVILDGPPDAGLGKAGEALKERGFQTVGRTIFTHHHGDRCARACALLVAWKGRYGWGVGSWTTSGRWGAPAPSP